MGQSGTAAMAKFGCAAVHQQLFLQGRSRSMVGMEGFCCEQMQKPLGFSSGTRIPATSQRGRFPSMMHSRRLEIGGLGMKRLPKRKPSLVVAAPLSCCFKAAATRIREDHGSAESSAGSIVGGRVPEWREEEEESVVSSTASENENCWRFEVENLIQGHVAKYTFLATLLLGVGVGYLTNMGDAEAATSQIRSHGGLDVDMRALALGPEGPLVEEFWDNMRRYGLYFLTVVSGGVYTLVKPAIDALRNPVTAVLVIVIVSGSIYLVGLTVSAMLGITEYKYDYTV